MLQRPGSFAIVDQFPKSSANGAGQFLDCLDAGSHYVPSFGQQPFQVGSAFVSIGGRLGCTQSRTQPTPQSWRYQKLPSPASETPPFRGTLRPPKPGANRACRFPENAVAEQSFDDDRACVPAPWMQPIRQQAHRVAAGQAQKAPDPNDDPTSFNKPANLSRVHAVPDQLQNTLGAPGRLATEDTILRTESLQKRGSRASCAELLDTNGKAM